MTVGRTTLRRLRVVEALGLLLVARLLRRHVPMRRWAPVLGRPGPPTVPTGPTGPTGREPLAGVEALVAGVVGSAARRVSADCLEQSVAASLMLRRRGAPAVVVVGLNRERPGDTPHAWLVGRSGAVVIGGDEMPGFRPVNQFGRLAPSRSGPSPASVAPGASLGRRWRSLRRIR